MSVRCALQIQARAAQNLRLTPVKLYSSSALAVNEDREIVETTVKPFGAIPGPKPLPLLRNALEYDVPKLHVYFEELHKKYGEIFKLEVPGSLYVCCIQRYM